MISILIPLLGFVPVFIETPIEEKEQYPENIEYCQNLLFTDIEKFKNINCSISQTQRSLKVDFDNYYNN